MAKSVNNKEKELYNDNAYSRTHYHALPYESHPIKKSKTKENDLFMCTPYIAQPPAAAKPLGWEIPTLRAARSALNDSRVGWFGVDCRLRQR